jgi:Glutamate dehydrogenase/leucine dehydrogenase
VPIGAPTILEPAAAARLAPDLSSGDPRVWVYRYVHPFTRWRLSIATHAEPGSQKLSLGGFRIAPAERTSAPGFDSDREAVGLAIGMEEKVHWSRLLGVGGPLARRQIARIVGGKCVLHPTPEARVGQPRDAELLDFAVACFKDVEARGGFRLTTGQDLGHGLMADGHTQSLQFLNARFKGSVVADTSKPTGEGNYHVLAGMARAFDVPLERATVGLVGCGNIGMHLVGKLRAHGTTLVALESSDARRAELVSQGIEALPPARKDEFFQRPMDAVAVNAAGGSLDPHAVALIAANERLRVVCGSENLVMPDHGAGSEALRAARKAYCPTELGGMMGYLTAVEEYLARVEGAPFDVGTLLEAARKLDGIAYEATRRVIAENFAISFEEAVKAPAGDPGN